MGDHEMTDTYDDTDRLASIEVFRTERLGEPTDFYHDVLDSCQGAFEELLELTVDLTYFGDDIVPQLLEEGLFTALRYVAGPPISADDAQVLAGVHSVTQAALKAHPKDAQEVFKVIMQAFDRSRFPWLAVIPTQSATDAERSRAIASSATLLASTRMVTERRSREAAKSDLVASGLRNLGYSEAERRVIRGWEDLPETGNFYRKGRLKGRVGTHDVNSASDFIIRTSVDVVMVVACRVSNSALNSKKRLTKETVPIARDWRSLLGEDRTVTAVVLGGVYDVETLGIARDDSLEAYWFHDLDMLFDAVVAQQ